MESSEYSSEALKLLLTVYSCVGMDISMNKKKIKIKKPEEENKIELEVEEEYEIDQPPSPNSAAVQTIIEEPVPDETPLNLVNK